MSVDSPSLSHHAKNMDMASERAVVAILISCVDAARPHC